MLLDTATSKIIYDVSAANQIAYTFFLTLEERSILYIICEEITNFKIQNSNFKIQTSKLKS